MNRNGKQQPTQSSHLGWLKTAFNWLFRTGDHQHEDFDGKVGDAVNKKRQDENVLSPADQDAASDNPDLPETSKQQQNPETTTRMPADNTIIVRDISPIRNEVEEMEVDQEAVDKNGSEQDKNMENLITVHEALKSAQVIENNVAPQRISTKKRLVPESSTESGVSPTNLHRSPPPAVGKLGDTTQMMSVLPTPPNSRITAGPPKRIYSEPPKLQFIKSPFFKDTRNPQPFEKALQREAPFEINPGSTSSALGALRLQIPTLEKGETEKGKEMEVEEGKQRGNYIKKNGEQKQQTEELVGKLEEGNHESEKKSQGGNGKLQEHLVRDEEIIYISESQIIQDKTPLQEEEALKGMEILYQIELPEVWDQITFNLNDLILSKRKRSDHLDIYKSPVGKEDHKDECQFLCQFCAEMFNSNAGLEFHLNTHEDKRINFDDDTEGQYKPKLLRDGHVKDLAGETSEEMTQISDSAAGSEASQSKPATEMEHAEDEIETFQDDTETGGDEDIEIGRKAKKQKLQGKIKPASFICTVCSQSCKSNWKLNQHFLTHSGERPYACDQCGKKFAGSGAFWNHQQTHTKGRPHECQFCGSRFTQARSMRAHVKKFHKYL